MLNIYEFEGKTECNITGTVEAKDLDEALKLIIKRVLDKCDENMKFSIELISTVSESKKNNKKLKQDTIVKAKNYTNLNVTPNSPNGGITFSG